MTLLHDHPRRHLTLCAVTVALTILTWATTSSALGGPNHTRSTRGAGANAKRFVHDTGAFASSALNAMVTRGSAAMRGATRRMDTRAAARQERAAKQPLLTLFNKLKLKRTLSTAELAELQTRLVDRIRAHGLTAKDKKRFRAVARDAVRKQLNEVKQASAVLDQRIKSIEGGASLGGDGVADAYLEQTHRLARLVEIAEVVTVGTGEYGSTLLARRANKNMRKLLQTARNTHARALVRSAKFRIADAEYRLGAMETGLKEARDIGGPAIANLQQEVAAISGRLDDANVLIAVSGHRLRGRLARAKLNKRLAKAQARKEALVTELATRELPAAADGDGRTPTVDLSELGEIF